MKKAKKFLVGLLAFASVSAFALGTVACGEDGTDSGNLPPEGQNAIQQVYDSYVEYATANGQTPLDYQAWLATIKGATGEQGVGIKNVYIENGHLFVILTEGDPIDCGPLPTEESNGSSNLSYIVNEDGLGYTLTGIGLCSDREVVIPDTYKGKPVTAIGDEAFDPDNGAGSYLITSITIPDSVTTIGDWAFSFCDSLESVTIGNSVTTIGEYAFRDCDSLTSVTLPDSVTTIGRNAFESCSNLTSVTIGDSVTTIRNSAFYACDSLESITVDDDNKQLKSIDGNLYSKDGKILIQYAMGKKAQTFIIPDSVTTIGEYAFYYCYNLTSVTIGNSVTTIGRNAFNGCDSLTSVTIPDSVTTIGINAFYNCYNLTSVTIPDSVTTIGEQAFYNCDNLESVTIGNSVTTIGEYAFYYCYNLTSVTIPDSVTTIGERAFYWCSNLTSVVFADTSTWYRTGNYEDWENKVNGTQVDVSDTETAADLLKDGYYYWYKL